MKTEIFIRNGEGLPARDAQTFLEASGIFETTRARFLREFNTIIIPWFQYHLERLSTSASALALALPYKLEIIEQDFLLALKLFPQFEAEDAVVKLTLSPLGHLVSIKPWKATFNLKTGIRAISINLERELPEHKSTFTTPSITARRLAESEGASEALLVDKLGILREGAWSNFFWVNGSGEIITPSKGVLPGITRRVVLEQFQSIERDFLYKDIISLAKEAFITHATHGIVPLSAIDDHQLSHGMPGNLTRKIQSRYESLSTPGSDAHIKTPHLNLLLTVPDL